MSGTLWMRTTAIRKASPKYIQGLKTSLQNVWDQLPKEFITCLISSMESCCDACISVRGGVVVLYYNFFLQPHFPILWLRWVLRMMMYLHYNCSMVIFCIISAYVQIEFHKIISTSSGDNRPNWNFSSFWIAVYCDYVKEIENLLIYYGFQRERIY